MTQEEMKTEAAAEVRELLVKIKDAAEKPSLSMIEMIDRLAWLLDLSAEERYFIVSLVESDDKATPAAVFADWLADHEREAEGHKYRLLHLMPERILVVRAASNSAKDLETAHQVGESIRSAKASADG